MSLVKVPVDMRQVVTLVAPLTTQQEFSVSPQAALIYEHIRKAGALTAYTALVDLQITSATLARRIVDLERVGVHIRRDRRKHPVSKRLYTSYAIAA